MKLFNFVIAFLMTGSLSFAQVYQGVVRDTNTDLPLVGVEVRIREDNQTATTNEQGEFLITGTNTEEKTLSWELDGYMFKEQYHLSPATNLDIQLRAQKMSAAASRLEGYAENGCDITIPNDANWSITYEQSDLQGDLAPNVNYTRRDPSAVIKVDGKFYVWYSYSQSYDYSKDAPWDLNDLYYATSTDGWNWQEQGMAVGRGEVGSFDHRSVFTTEIFVDKGVFYLVYQAAADENGIYDRNTVGMAYANSPDGPWTKLEEPVLHPTYTDEPFFDRNAVHDPCIVHFNDKYYLYYKGECSYRNTNNQLLWCNPVCGTMYYLQNNQQMEKQVKWGVAISDSPTGPFVKSEYNPITNTGHEISVWTYNDGVAILQHQDGPEGGTIQFAEDGVNFEIKGSVANFPEAPGFYRPVSEATSPVSGVSWGICHVLKWDGNTPKGWMYLRRFENQDKQKIVNDDGISTLVSEEKNSELDVIPNPVDDELSVEGLMEGRYTYDIVDLSGELIQSGTYLAQGTPINVRELSNGYYILNLSQGNNAYHMKFVK